jgi:hypothetical protein
MRVQWQQSRPGQLDYELIWLSVTTIAAVMMMGWLALHLPWPRCTFRALFGIPCVSCGSTRSALAFFRGDFPSAWHFNPLATITLGSIAAFDVYALATLIGNRPRLRIVEITRSERRIVMILLVAAAGCNWCYLLWNSNDTNEVRLVPGPAVTRVDDPP